MIKKNIGFLIVFLFSVSIFVFTGVYISQHKEEKNLTISLSEVESLKDEKKQKIPTNKKILIGEKIEKLNEPTEVKLEWQFSRDKVQRSELYLNEKTLLGAIYSSNKNRNINVRKNNLKAGKNEFSIKIHYENSEEEKISAVVDVGYIYDMFYQTEKKDGKLYLNYHYYTNNSTPVSAPKLVSAGNLKLIEVDSHSTKEDEFTKNEFVYEVDTSKYEPGTYEETLKWVSESVNYEFSQLIFFEK